MTLYNKKLSDQCNLIAQIEQVYDIFIYDYTAISACTAKIKGYVKTFALYVSKMIKYPGTLRRAKRNEHLLKADCVTVL